MKVSEYLDLLRIDRECNLERVVHCRDCKWWKEETEYEWDGETELKQQLCTEHDAYFEPDDFCSYGERREPPCGSP